jgi:hypothetical protein
LDNIAHFISFEKLERLCLRFLILIILSLVCWSCGSVPKEKSSPIDRLLKLDEYAGWQVVESSGVMLTYPPDHIHTESFASIANSYRNAANAIANRLHMRPYADTIYVAFYTGYGQGREMTGEHWPHIKDGVIHFWQPSFAGMTLTDLLLQEWVENWPPHPIFYHGLRAQFDYRGINYHERTQTLMERDSFYTLIELAESTVIVSDSERVQTAEAASLIAYMLAYYGPEKLLSLCENESEFVDIVSQELNITLDSLQDAWLRFMRARLPVKDTAQ